MIRAGITRLHKLPVKAPPMPTTSKLQKPRNVLLRMDAVHRMLLSFGGSLLTAAAIWTMSFSPLIKGMMMWDAFSLTFLLCSWMVFFSSTPADIRHRASKEDGSRFLVFLVVMFSSVASMVTVLILILSKDSSSSPELYVPVAIAGILLSWVMVHTTYTLHYAFLYYADSKSVPDKHFGGLDFPGDEKPDYLDFAYFSFVVGMTFQVSDVEITSRVIRKKVLVHGLLSFALNTFVVALTVNLVAGMKG